MKGLVNSQLLSSKTLPLSSWGTPIVCILDFWAYLMHFISFFSTVLYFRWLLVLCLPLVKGNLPSGHGEWEKGNDALFVPYKEGSRQACCSCLWARIVLVTWAETLASHLRGPSNRDFWFGPGNYPIILRYFQPIRTKQIWIPHLHIWTWLKTGAGTFFKPDSVFVL